MRDYKKVREHIARVCREASFKGRDIGPIPEVSNPLRKLICRDNFGQFCSVYLSNAFVNNWSLDHLLVLNVVQEVVLNGGQYVLAMPRGFGKSTILQAAALWALLYGHHKFVVIVCADEGLANSMLAGIKTILEQNDLLLADFPEVCYPIRMLEGIHNRANGQHINGVRTQIKWTRKQIVLPWVEGSVASGSIVLTAGITGRIRGIHHTLPDGTVIRPSLLLLDDLQTDESARSVTQTLERERILNSAILGLAGKQKMSVLFAGTVIEPGDLTDRLLTLNPQWKSQRFKLVYNFPKRMDLWEQCYNLYLEDVKEGTRKWIDFYEQHKEEMQEGADIAWQEFYPEGYVDALQYAMFLYFRDKRSFYAEQQNSPADYLRELPKSNLLTPEAINRTNGLPRKVVPIDSQFLTAYIDVHASLLFYVVCSWSKTGGSVVDYGTWPRQNRSTYSVLNANPSIEDIIHGSLEAQIYGALEKLTEEILGYDYKDSTGDLHKVRVCFVDANWGQMTDVIYKFCRQSKFANVLMPVHGRYVSYGWGRQYPGEKMGQEWKLTRGQRKQEHIVYNTNYWKSVLARRLTSPIGHDAIEFFGVPSDHHLFVDHLTSEVPSEVIRNGQRIEEWRLLPSRENHYFDCLVGCLVAASYLGHNVDKREKQQTSKRKRSLADYVTTRIGTIAGTFTSIT